VQVPRLRLALEEDAAALWARAQVLGFVSWEATSYKKNSFFLNSIMSTLRINLYWTGLTWQSGSEGRPVKVEKCRARPALTPLPGSCFGLNGPVLEVASSVNLVPQRGLVR
jgi:hypothetical protein